MAVTLVIKGPVKSAKRAAARHGVPVKKCRRGSTGTDVICEAPCKAELKAGRWFGEKATKRAGRGFSPGTLLFMQGRCPNGKLGGAKKRRRRRKR